MGSDHFHRICTYKEAEEAIRKNEAIYVNDSDNFETFPGVNGLSI